MKNNLYIIEQAGMLMQMPRSHIRSLGTAFDTIASHSFHVSFIAYILAKMKGLSDQDANKATTMALMHDLAEARTGDHDFVAKNYNKCHEEKAIKDQFGKLKFANSLIDLSKEYEKKETYISKIVKDADQLAQIYHERVLSWQGNKLAQQRFEGDYEKRVPFLNTESAKQIAYQMKDSNPNERRRDEFITNNYNSDNLKN